MGKDFSGTNKAVYRSLDLTTNQFYLRVDDTNAQYAAVILMYETMSNVDTGLGFIYYKILGSHQHRILQRTMVCNW